MNDVVTEGGADIDRGDAANRAGIVTAISSGEGHPIAPEPARWGFSLQHGLMLLAAGVALGVLTGLWVQRVR